MVSEIASKQMDKGSPILARLFKEESELEIWKQNQDGQFALLKTYPICRWSGDLGPKKREGDRQAPEGFYTITPGQMNPNSNYYLAFNTGYPNAYDRAWGRAVLPWSAHRESVTIRRPGRLVEGGILHAGRGQSDRRAARGVRDQDGVVSWS